MLEASEAWVVMGTVTATQRSYTTCCYERAKLIEYETGRDTEVGGAGWSATEILHRRWS